MLYENTEMIGDDIVDTTPDTIVDTNDINKLSGTSNDHTKFEKFGQGSWKKIEEMYNENTLNILSVVSSLGDDISDTTNTTNKIQTIGDENYLKIRPDLVKAGIVDKTVPILISGINSDASNNKKKSNNTNGPKHRKGPQKISKEEVIKQNIFNQTKKLFADVINTIKTNSSGRVNCQYAFNAKFAELRLIGLMYMAKNCLKIKNNEQECYELSIGIAKTLNNVSIFNGVSKVAREDLRILYDALNNKCKFKYETMFKKYPKYCLSTTFDTVFPTMSIKPYDSQCKLMNAIKNIKKCLCFYKAMIGSGKTSTSVAIMRYIQHMRIQLKANNISTTTQLLFVCSVEPVRREVCKMAYNMNVPFAIGIIDTYGALKIINNYNCSSESERVLIVVDLMTAIKMLEKSQDYIMFIDEPTVGADIPNNATTNAVVKLLAMAPEKTILSSATLPNPEEIPEIVEHFKSRHEGAEVYTVYSREAMIGCELINFNGTSIVPYASCNTVDELRHVIEQLQTKPFIDRMLPAPVVYNLKTTMERLGVPDVINLEEYFKDVNKLCQSEIQKVAIMLLEQLADTGDNSIITQVCQTPVDFLHAQPSTETTNEGIAFGWDNGENEDTNPTSLNLDKIFTTDAYKCAGPCLVATMDPIKFALIKSATLFANCPPLYKIINDYEESIVEYHKKINKLDTSIKNDDDRSQLAQDIHENQRPVLNFPSYLRVNSEFHLEKYAPHMVDIMDTKLLQPFNLLENIPLDTGVCDDILRLLFAGIGLYSENNPMLPQKYIDTVLNMASNGQLAFLIADDTICYGANYPFCVVVVKKCIVRRHSKKTLLQLLGRGGRVGESWISKGYIEDEFTRRFIDLVHGRDQDTDNDDSFDEAKNMTNAFIKAVDDLKKERNEAYARKIKKNALPLQSKRTLLFDESMSVTCTPMKTMHGGVEITVNTIKINEIKSNSPPKTTPMLTDLGLTTTPITKEDSSEYVPPHMRETNSNPWITVGKRDKPKELTDRRDDIPNKDRPNKDKPNKDRPNKDRPVNRSDSNNWRQR